MPLIDLPMTFYSPYEHYPLEAALLQLLSQLLVQVGCGSLNQAGMETSVRV